MNRRAATRPLVTLAVVPVVTALLGCAVRIGGNSKTAPADSQPREALRISVDEAFAAVRAGRAVLVDVRGAESFRQKRAAGAVLLTLEDIERAPRDMLAALPPGRQPIFYCT